MKRSKLERGYSAFGNKGDIAGGTIHICKDGLNPDTLCGRPMLSTNHAVQADNVTHDIGCAECIAVYNKPQWLADSEYFRQMENGTHGSFAKSLSETWRLADIGNRRALVEAFPRYFNGYRCY